MIGPVVTRGLAFAVKYLVTAGFLPGEAPEEPAGPIGRNIFRITATGASKTFRPMNTAGTGDIFRGSASPGKVFR